MCAVLCVGPVALPSSRSDHGTAAMSADWDPAAPTDQLDQILVKVKVSDHVHQGQSVYVACFKRSDELGLT